MALHLEWQAELLAQCNKENTMAETPEDRVNKRADKLRQYKDKQGMSRTADLNQKQMDEALHREVTGNTDIGQATAEADALRKQRSRPIPAQINTAAAQNNALPVLEQVQNQPNVQPNRPVVPLADALNVQLARDNIQGVTVSGEDKANGGQRVQPVSTPPIANYLGYGVRQPSKSEMDYFNANPNVAGMATEDNNIIFNPNSKLTEEQQQAVGTKEAIRLFLRNSWDQPMDFAVTPEQLRQFAGTDYAKPENQQELRSTIISRILTGDPSAGNVTEEQMRYAESVRNGILEQGRRQVEPVPTRAPERAGVPVGQPEPTPSGLDVEPPPVRVAEKNEPPGMGKQALAALGAFIPGLGGALMEPFAKAQRSYLEKSAKDTKLADLFWKEMEEDPINAKRFARVPVVRDALQRKYGMSADEIIDLDKSISQVSSVKAKDVFDMAEKGLIELPPTVETEFGQLKTRPAVPQTKTIGGLPYQYNPTTNQYELMQTEVMAMYDDAVAGYKEQGFSDNEAALMAMRAVKGQPIFTTTKVGNGIVLMKNDALGKVKKFVFDDAVKKDFAVEIVKNELTKLPIGAFVYQKGKMPTNPEDVMFLSFQSMTDTQGNNVGDLIRGYAEEEAKQPGLISRLISKIFGGAEVTDHSRLLEGEAEPSGAPASAPSGPVTPPPVASPSTPVAAPAAPPVNNENKKVRQLLLDTGAM